MNTNFLDYINWLAVIAGGLGYFMLGAIWYSKLLFAPKWISYIKVDVNNPEAKKGMGAIMFASFVLMFITAAGIAILRSKLGISGWMSGLKLGTVTGLCFGATAISISYLYEKRPFGLHLINGCYTLLGNIIAAVIICCWL
ncbi:MAG: DUF1761 domain-containing protein [Ferruginibacter sp.]